MDIHEAVVEQIAAFVYCNGRRQTERARACARELHPR